MSSNDYFFVYSNCMLVKGASRSLICDLHRSSYEFIPNSLYEILNSHSLKSITEIKAFFLNDYDGLIDEYFSFLVEKEFIYKCSNELRDYFPKLNESWDFPARITNAIIDCDGIPYFINSSVVNLLDGMGCKHIQFRMFKQVDYASFYDRVISCFDLTGFSTIKIMLPFKEGAATILKEWMKSNIRIQEIVVYNAPEDSTEYFQNFTISCLQFTVKNIDSSRCCGIVGMGYFAINIPHYTESLAHNTCLNRKIAIDVEGNIKNCPSMKESFGNIKDTTLAEALNKPGFKKYWNITKDDITKCKDCEFRHVCTDCRAYIENPEDMYSAPLKCGYDPYTCEWEEWSTNPLKQQAIEHYGMQELVKKA